MTTLRTTSGWLNVGVFAAVAGVVLTFPLASARADDDWDDDVEDYYEELEERREDARERYEEWRDNERERREEWREDRWRGRHRYQGFYGPGVDYRGYRGRPAYRTHYYDGPRPYPYYVNPPVPRYYGTPRVGYGEYGRHRSLRIGGVEVHWDRD